MAKYLLKANYSVEGFQGLKKEGAVNRVKAVSALVSGLGGTVESFNYSFGETDAYVICDLPNNTTAAALATAVTMSGAVSLTTVVLLTPEEVDAALATDVAYRPPGA
jgi:uncharacterized protein with GYD domain